MLRYTTGGGRHYKIEKIKKGTGKLKGKVSRVSCSEMDDPRINKKIGHIAPKKNSKVIIIIKPYHKYICKTGIVKDVLTKKKIHTRGHKVRLKTGEVGRTLKILK